MAASMPLAILCNLSSCGNLSVLSPSLSVKSCLFFFLGGESVTIARFILPEAGGANKNQEIGSRCTQLAKIGGFFK